MSHYHVEVHNRTGEIEHLVCLNCQDREEAISRIIKHYAERKIEIGLWDDVKNNPEVPYYIFHVSRLDDDKSVLYISGEYRSQYPI